ncbi:MAG: histidine phosphatase family protein [Conexibacter sp.]|jgi:broad specificity phosphatase PhoE|nr:histidine phosphatase family protein [Conexibacter sp.]
MSNNILLARHGQTADNAGGRILGRRDPPLTAVGLAQADHLAAAVRDAGVRAVWTSPLLRARRTAEVVGAALGLEPVVLADLVESARGCWEGRSVAEIARETPDLHAAFVAADPSFAFPGGESLREQAARTERALGVIAHGPLPALVVAHAGTIRASLALWHREVPPESALPHGEIAARFDAAPRRM